MICGSPKPFAVFLFFITFSLATAQSSGEGSITQSDLLSYIQEKHGSDQTLINGIIFYNKYHRVLKHPYYLGEKSLPGSIVLSGIRYDNVKINYDIFSQFLVLEYEDESGSIYKIILNPDQTDAFHLDGDYFEKVTLDEKGALFYQVVTQGDFNCLIHWNKQMISTSNNLRYANTFTDPKRTYFLDISGTAHPFSSRRTFASLFTGVPVKKIKKYMRENEIRFPDASSEQIEGLLKFVSSHMESTSGI